MTSYVKLNNFILKLTIYKLNAAMFSQCSLYGSIRTISILYSWLCFCCVYCSNSIHFISSFAWKQCLYRTFIKMFGCKNNGIGAQVTRDFIVKCWKRYRNSKLFLRVFFSNIRRINSLMLYIAHFEQTEYSWKKKRNFFTRIP